MTVERIDKNRPVVYRNHVIKVEKDKHRYVYNVQKTYDIQLSGVAMSLEEAFTEARRMIDKMEDI